MLLLLLLLLTDCEGRINRKSVRSCEFPFPSMETDGRKSLCIATRDQNYVLSGVNAIEDGLKWGRTNEIYLLANYALTDKFCMELMLTRQGPRIFYIL